MAVKLPSRFDKSYPIINKIVAYVEANSSEEKIAEALRDELAVDWDNDIATFQTTEQAGVETDLAPSVVGDLQTLFSPIKTFLYALTSLRNRMMNELLTPELIAKWKRIQESTLLAQARGADEFLNLDHGVIDSLFDRSGFSAEVSQVYSGFDNSNTIWVQYFSIANQNLQITKTVAQDFYAMTLVDTISGFPGGFNLYRGFVDLSASAPGTSLRWKSDDSSAVETIIMTWR